MALKITLDEIPEEGALDVEFFEGAEVLNELFKKGLEGDFHFDSPVKGSFHISKSRDVVFLDFDISGTLKMSCSRCLVEFECALEDSNRLTLFPCAEESEGETALDEEAIERAFYHDERLDLDEILKEQVALLIPFNPLCRDDCKGLCPECGQDLNNGDCNCSERGTNERFEILKNFKF